MTRLGWALPAGGAELSSGAVQAASSRDPIKNDVFISFSSQHLTAASVKLSRAPISAAGALGGQEESKMTTNRKPGNHPSPDDMSSTFEDGSEAQDPAAVQRKLEQEEEAERLGNFA